MNDQEMLGFFIEVSKIFRILYQEPLWSKYDLDYHTDAASLFLEGYAFEHQWRNPSFSPAAIEAIKRSKDSKEFPHDVWENFRGLLNTDKLNLNLNPLYHREISCKNCIWCVLESENIVQRSQRDLDTSKTRAALERLKEIRGVGDKIASFFLRDVAIWYPSTHIDKEDRWLLQPIDIWVKRTVQYLSRLNMNNEEVAKWIVDNCGQPECCNQGIWYFGARIAGSDYTLRKSILDMNYAKRISEDHIAIFKTLSSRAIFSNLPYII